MKITTRLVSSFVPLLLCSCGGGSNAQLPVTQTTQTSQVADSGSDTPRSPQSALATQVVEFVPAGQNGNDYILSFQDEFNSAPTVDANKWSTDIWYKPNNPTQNFDVDGSSLQIWPMRDSSGNFFDRTLVTANKFMQQYGFFEVEAKLPRGAGLHPVISLVGTGGPEIGIMHSYSGAPGGGWSSVDLAPIDYVVTALSAPGTLIGEFRAHAYRALPDLSAGFHKYGVRWDENSVRYFFDGEQVGPPITHNNIRSPMYFYIGLWMVNEETAPTVGTGTLNRTNPYTPEGPGNALAIRYVRAWRFKQ